MTEQVIDPYGGYRENWTQTVLDEASQGAGIVFDHSVVRAAPLTNQITLGTIAHYEACGPTALAIAAYACGLIEDPAANAIAACNFLGAASVAQSGTGTAQLLAWAANQGWSVHVDNRPAGDLDADLLGKGLIGISALEVSYGTGASWNDLHPHIPGEAARELGHWETFGDVDATHGDAMTPDQYTQLCGFGSYAQYLLFLGRPPESVPAWQARSDRIGAIGFTSSMWEMTGSPEGMSSGGLAGRLSALNARIAAVEQHVASLPTVSTPAQPSGASVAYDPAPVEAEIATIQKELADLHAALAAGAVAVGGGT